MVERETWATRAGFILAAIGSAVGLGNIWRFPFQTATNGGSAFLLVYLVAVLVIGIPALLGEFVVGRRANINAIEAFNKLGRPQWAFVGAIGVLGSFWTLSYYSVVGGWVLRFIYGFASGVVLDQPQTYFTDVAATGLDAVALHGLFMLVTAGIVALGIEDGIELATKFMVPSIVVLLLGLAVYAFTLPGSGAGYEFYLSPDFATVVENWTTVVPAAAGQALFSLSVGFAVMITYASYLSKDDSLPADGLTIAVSNSFVGFLAGLVVIPLLFAAGITIGGEGSLVSGSGGAGAVFIGVTTALVDLPGLAARVVGALFFGTVLIAAISSSISLLEAVVSYLVDNYALPRAPTAAGLGGVVFLLGVPSALDTAWLTWFDGISVSLFLPVVVLLVVLFVGWELGGEAVDELRQGTSGGTLLPMVWLWSLRTVVLLAILVVVGLNFYDLFLTPEAGDYFIVPPGL
ncbi:sodium-dependent transporter [Halomarina oriensis]|uniref:Sodium-dependent transporter n=1 Tax=Halomarina oriensis TaxID=671145 RepID=A0A6B0GP48_9EURY|nr:sodium-dependent transporter [Halomarina oriensis]MWG35751.1 sodium-dependent transporter [Halomarina oriensis]